LDARGAVVDLAGGDNWPRLTVIILVGRPERAAYGLFGFTEVFTEEIDGNECGQDHCDDHRRAAKFLEGRILNQRAPHTLRRLLHITTLIVTDNMERVLADIDTDHGDCALELLGHGVLLVFGTPSPHSIAGGAGARPDHPINGHHKMTGFPKSSQPKVGNSKNSVSQEADGVGNARARSS
jgi:hypothetical protein